MDGSDLVDSGNHSASGNSSSEKTITESNRLEDVKTPAKPKPVERKLSPQNIDDLISKLDPCRMSPDVNDGMFMHRDTSTDELETSEFMERHRRLLADNINYGDAAVAPPGNRMSNVIDDRLFLNDGNRIPIPVAMPGLPCDDNAARANVLRADSTGSRPAPKRIDSVVGASAKENAAAASCAAAAKSANAAQNEPGDKFTRTHNSSARPAAEQEKATTETTQTDWKMEVYRNCRRGQCRQSEESSQCRDEWDGEMKFCGRRETRLFSFYWQYWCPIARGKNYLACSKAKWKQWKRKETGKLKEKRPSWWKFWQCATCTIRASYGVRRVIKEEQCASAAHKGWTRGAHPPRNLHGSIVKAPTHCTSRRLHRHRRLLVHVFRLYWGWTTAAMYRQAWETRRRVMRGRSSGTWSVLSVSGMRITLEETWPLD